MNAETLPLIVAATGGPALLGGIYWYERRRMEVMRASQTRLSLRFPGILDATAALGVLTQWSGLPDHIELVLETIATHAGITHALAVPAEVAESVTCTLPHLWPGTRLTPAPRVSGSAMLAVGLFATTPILLREDDPAASAQALLGGLTGLRDGEMVVIRWVLRTTTTLYAEPREPLGVRAKEIDTAWRKKLSGPGFAAGSLVLIRATSLARARELAQHITGVWRSRRGQAGSLRVTSSRSGRPMMSRPATGRRSGWLSAAEVLGLVGWPIGGGHYAGVERGATRELPVPRGLGSSGRLLLVGRTVTGDEQPIALSARTALQHQAIIGPSGTGKSTLMAANILSDLARGHGGVLFDPKGPDLVNAVADRVPPELTERVVILDPAGGGAVPGVNILASGDPDLASDVVLGALAAVFKENWGIRSAHYGRLAVRTLAGLPDARLTDLGRLFADDRFRARALARLDDPILRAAWEQYGTLSAGEAASHVQPFLTKAVALLSRPAVRSVLAAQHPKLDIARLLTERSWLLVSLSPGRLGEAASQLLGSTLMYAVWAAIERRGELPEDARHPVYLYIDELATLTGLPISFELLAERSRGLGAGLVVALQTSSRLPENVRRSLLGNVSGALLTFRAGAEEAAKLAKEFPGLEASDLMALGTYEVAARVSSGGPAGLVTITGRTEPPAPLTDQGATIRAHSAERYGSPTDAEATLHRPSPRDSEAPVRRLRRPA